MTRPVYDSIDFDAALGRHHAKSTAIAVAYAALEAQAKHTAARIVKDLADQYAKNPRMLDLIEPRLSHLRPRDLRYRLEVLTGRENTMQRRHGGETVRINLAAAMMFAESLVEAEA